MPPTTIEFADGILGRVQGHLLPIGGECEEAAFLFTQPLESEGGTVLHAFEEMLIPPEGFVSRSGYYLELSDESRASVIKRAHDLKAGLIECHSHPTQRRACFSWSDLHGFDEFVPHVRWRLGGRPYGAIVFAPGSIDALVWVGPGRQALPVGSVRADRSHLKPTGLTVRNWEDIYERPPL